MTLRIGIIGATGHTQYVLRGAQELEDAAITAVAPGSPEESIDGLVQRLRASGSPRVYADYRELLESEPLDVVAVNPFFHLHASVASDALAAGVPVYCEKPFALTVEDLAGLRSVWEQSSLPLGIMLDFRYNPAFYTARALVAAGAIGTPTVGYAQKSYRFGTRPDVYRRRETFGGVTPWVGIHAIDWFRWVSGVEYTAVRSVHSKLHRPDYPGMEDAVTCLYELANGGTAVMSFDYLRPAGAPTHGDDRLRLLGDQGALEIQHDRLELITAAGVSTPDIEQSPHGCFADFARSVVDPSHVCRLSAEEGFRSSYVALKTREAADAGTRVELQT